MKKIFFALLALVLVANAGLDMPKMQKGMKMPYFRAVSLDKAQILQDNQAKIFCVKCGMTLPKFYKTNHAAKVDGKIEQFCSMHCLVEEINSGKNVTDIQVVDNTTLKFIPVDKAWYVVGSNKPATMSQVSKYAFGEKAAAEAFAKNFGGKVMRFKELLAQAKASFEKEKKMIAIRQAKMAKMGEKIYNTKCKKIEQKFHSPAEAKSYIKAHNSCLEGKALQAVGLYLSR